VKAGALLQAFRYKRLGHHAYFVIFSAIGHLLLCAWVLTHTAPPLADFRQAHAARMHQGVVVLEAVVRSPTPTTERPGNSDRGPTEVKQTETARKRRHTYPVSPRGVE
jgi:hypothetical protein